MACVSQASPFAPARRRAQELAASGDVAGARAILEKAVELGKANLSEDDPDVLLTAYHLAGIYQRLDDPSAARRVLEEAYAAGQWRLGDHDPLMVEISHDIGVVAEDLGNRHEARKAFTRVVEHGPAALGATHQAVARAQAYLGHTPDSVRSSALPAATAAAPGSARESHLTLVTPVPSVSPFGEQPPGPEEPPVLAPPVPTDPVRGTPAPATPAPAPSPRRSAEGIDEPTVVQSTVTPRGDSGAPPAQPYLRAQATGLDRPAEPTLGLPAPVDPAQARPSSRLGAPPVARPAESSGPNLERSRQGLDRTVPGPTEPARGFDRTAPGPGQFVPGFDRPAAGLGQSAPQVPAQRPPEQQWAPPPPHHHLIAAGLPAAGMPARGMPVGGATPPVFGPPTGDVAYRKRGLGLFAAIAAVLASLIAVAALVFVLANRGTDPPADPGVPTLAGRAPTGLRLGDHGSEIEVSWADPSPGRVSFIVLFAHPGEEFKALTTLGPGTTSYRAGGLNAKLNYCFAVAAVYSAKAFATSGQSCTSRRPIVPAPSTGK